MFSQVHQSTDEVGWFLMVFAVCPQKNKKTSATTPLVAYSGVLHFLALVAGGGGDRCQLHGNWVVPCTAKRRRVRCKAGSPIAA